MASYNVTSGFPDLNGSCEIDGDDCTSYTSNNLGAGTVRNIGGPSTLMFQVNFPGPGNLYTIGANSNGSGYSGEASNGGENVRDIDEPWAASATQPAVAAKGY